MKPLPAGTSSIRFSKHWAGISTMNRDMPKPTGKLFMKTGLRLVKRQKPLTIHSGCQAEKVIFVEAKKPSVAIKDDIYQPIR